VGIVLLSAVRAQLAPTRRFIACIEPGEAGTTSPGTSCGTARIAAAKVSVPDSLDPRVRVPVGFGECALESCGAEILTVRRCSWLLAPRVVQPTTVDRVEAEIVDEAKYRGSGVRCR
jgi:hypothetical protein